MKIEFFDSAKGRKLLQTVCLYVSASVRGCWRRGGTQDVNAAACVNPRTTTVCVCAIATNSVALRSKLLQLGVCVCVCLETAPCPAASALVGAKVSPVAGLAWSAGRKFNGEDLRRGKLIQLFAQMRAKGRTPKGMNQQIEVLGNSNRNEDLRG